MLFVSCFLGWVWREWRCFFRSDKPRCDYDHRNDYNDNHYHNYRKNKHDNDDYGYGDNDDHLAGDYNHDGSSGGGRDHPRGVHLYADRTLTGEKRRVHSG